ncbi:UPF0235 protein LHK_03181 [Opitutia bacterium]|nr:UPF0235 protein LHK_03181 [Opitutae bacterium]
MSGPACRLRVKVVPGASRSEVVGLLGAAVKVRVAAPPEGGQANREVCALLAERLGLPLAQVTVVAGPASPVKVIGLVGITETEAKARLLA